MSVIYERETTGFDLSLKVDEGYRRFLARDGQFWELKEIHPCGMVRLAPEDGTMTRGLYFYPNGISNLGTGEAGSYQIVGEAGPAPGEPGTRETGGDAGDNLREVLESMDDAGDVAMERGDGGVVLNLSRAEAATVYAILYRCVTGNPATSARGHADAVHGRLGPYVDPGHLRPVLATLSSHGHFSDDAPAQEEPEPEPTLFHAPVTHGLEPGERVAYAIPSRGNGRVPEHHVAGYATVHELQGRMHRDGSVSVDTVGLDVDNGDLIYDREPDGTYRAYRSGVTLLEPVGSA